MSLSLPEFREDRLQWLAVCIHFEQAPLPSLGPNGAHICKISGESDAGREVWLRRIIDSEPEMEIAHYHVEVGFRTGGFQRDGQDRALPLDEITAIPPSVIGKSVSATIWGRFGTKTKDLGENAAVAALLGVELLAGEGDYQLTLSGANWDVSGDGPFMELRWWTRDDDIVVEIGAYDEVSIDDELLRSCAAIAERGFSELVLGKRPEMEDQANGN